MLGGIIFIVITPIFSLWKWEEHSQGKWNDFRRVTKKEEGLGVRTWFTLRSRTPFCFPLCSKAGSGVLEGASKIFRNYGFSDSITYESVSSRVTPPSVHPTKNISDCLLPVWVPGLRGCVDIQDLHLHGAARLLGETDIKSHWPWRSVIKAASECPGCHAN